MMYVHIIPLSGIEMKRCRITSPALHSEGDAGMPDKRGEQTGGRYSSMHVRKKIMPVSGPVIINLKEMKSNVKTFGLDIIFRKYINFTLGASATFLNETKIS